jgi:hypothetical protein
MKSQVREQLVATALLWEQRFGNAPSITSALSEYDAAMLLGMSEEEYSSAMKNATAVRKGFDFVHRGHRYQVKGNRPSGKPGSPVTLVPKARNYEWDYLVWILYDSKYELQEAWQWEAAFYQQAFHECKRLSPADHRNGKCLTPRGETQ